MVAGRRLRPTTVFDTYWRFAAARQQVYQARLRGDPALIDCQNLFCEVDKYARVAHPEITGYSGRTRIKQRFTPVDHALTSWFPPKWGINGSVEEPIP